MIQRVLISFGLTTLVSILFGLIFGAHFWLVFFLAFILQVLLFYFINSVYENKLIEKAQSLRLQEYAIQSKQIALIECPCAEKTKQEVEMRFDKDVTYVCNKCNKSIKAAVDVKSVLMTEPIYFNDRA